MLFGPAVRFPGVCARCAAAPPTTTCKVVGADTEERPEGRTVLIERRIDVPVCRDCKSALAGSFWWSLQCGVPLGVLTGVWVFTLRAPPPRSYWAWVGICIFAGMFAASIFSAIFRLLFFRNDCVFARFEGEQLVFSNPDYQRRYAELNPPRVPDSPAPPPWAKNH